MLFAPLGVASRSCRRAWLDTEFDAAGTPDVSISAEYLAETVRHVLAAPAEVDLSTVIVRPRRQLL